MNEMFCFQCEQTAGDDTCTAKAGVCGKLAANTNLQDELTDARPAFISPNVLNFLAEDLTISPISTPKEDLKAILT